MGDNRSKTPFERKTRPWSTPSFTVAATHYAIVESSSSTLLFFLICIHPPSNIALTSKFRLQHTKRWMVSHRFYCDQSLLHLRALLNLWSVVLTFKDLITFVTNYYVCGFSRVSLRQFFSIEIFKRWKEIPLYCPLKNRYTRHTRYSRYTRTRSKPFAIF